MARRFALFGDNRRAFHSQAADLLLAGPAGTGKTIALLLKIVGFAYQFPGVRILLVRKTRTSLTETGLVTLERDVLGFSHKVLTSRPVMRRVRQDYVFPNGSVIVVGGLDNPEKVLSSEYDLIYMLEATDFTLDDYETISGRLRTGTNPAAPFQQLIADCNPTTPQHWLFSKISSGKMLRLNSKHRDNPAYWDQARGEWTLAGRRYVETRLKNMTGARRKRFYEGIWAAAEGLVFDGYDPKLHDREPGWRPPPDWRVFWSIDWGFTAPLSLQMWALDGDNRMTLYREIYQTGLRVETLAKQCRALVDSHEEPRPFAVVTDHDPEAQETWRVHSGLPCESAWKEDKYEGIELAQGRFDLAGDGKPKIFFVPNARYHPADDRLSDVGKPSCTLEELGGYVWDVKDIDKKTAKELPVKLNDHGMDNLRYAAVYVERNMNGLQFATTGSHGDSIHGDLRNQSW